MPAGGQCGRLIHARRHARQNRKWSVARLHCEMGSGHLLAILAAISQHGEMAFMILLQQGRDRQFPTFCSGSGLVTLTKDYRRPL